MILNKFHGKVGCAAPRAPKIAKAAPLKSGLYRFSLVKVNAA
jgi:hypothetical protein